MKVLIASLCFAIVGCASSGALPANDPAAAVAVLTVMNRRTEQAAIYLVHAGHKSRRLGDVNSLASETFVLTAADIPPADEIQFLAQISVSGNTELSDPVLSSRGAVYKWVIGPSRGQQTVSQHYMSH